MRGFFSNAPWFWWFALFGSVISVAANLSTGNHLAVAWTLIATAWMVFAEVLRQDLQRTHERLMESLKQQTDLTLRLLERQTTSRRHY